MIDIDMAIAKKMFDNLGIYTDGNGLKWLAIDMKFHDNKLIYVRIDEANNHIVVLFDDNAYSIPLKEFKRDDRNVIYL